MRREGTDESNVQMSDVICDSCNSVWTDDRPMVEGHQGSCICGPCLSVAYAEVALQPNDDEPCIERTCTLCLENKGKTPGETKWWVSPMDESAVFCRQCIKRAAGVLHKDPDIPWFKPTS